MAQYYSPGVYIEEVDKGPQPIEGVATAVAAFVGFTPYSSQEDANRPVLITSWTQYVQRFGLPDIYGRKNPYMKGAYLSHAVFGFFQNGGSRCYVVRVAPAEWKYTQKLLANSIKIPGNRDKTQAVLEALPIAADGVGKDIQVTITPSTTSKPEDGRFLVRVRQGDIEEGPFEVELPKQPEPASSSTNNQQASDDQASASAAQGNPKKNQKASSNHANLLKKYKESTLIELYELSSSGDIEARMPAFGPYVIAIPQPEETAIQSIQPPAIIGEITERSGVLGLEIAPDVTMVCCPDLMSPLINANDEASLTRMQSVQLAMITHCELSGDRMAILDAPPDYDAQKIEDWRVNKARYDSMYAALYYPWITIANPLAEEKGEPLTINVPPSGHIAGIYARNDATRGVHKAPANEIVRGALRPVKELTNGEQDGLNPKGVNCIRTFPGRSAVVWGARTLSTSKPAWRYINVRRLFNYVEKSIELGTQWVVFEPNDPELWSRVRRDVSAFLMPLWRDGMLFGNTPQEAFRVKCDEELNPADSRDQGRLIIEVSLAPVKPAEFVIFRFSQLTSTEA